MVRRQMYGALMQIVFLGGTGALGVYGIISRRLSLGQFLLFLLLNGVLFTIGALGKRIEGRARSLPVEDEALASEYEAVCHAWIKKPLPDF